MHYIVTVLHNSLTELAWKQETKNGNSVKSTPHNILESNKRARVREREIRVRFDSQLIFFLV